MPDRQPQSIVVFGSFEFNVRTGELREAQTTVRLQEQPFQILKMLVEYPGEMVTREQIRKRLWPNDTIVDFDHSINAAIKRLRVVLGDSASEPRYVETVARRGYRLIAPVKLTGIQSAHGPCPEVQPSDRAPAPSQAYVIGKKVSHYRVLEVLGGGGMGLVCMAEDLTLGRRVALKFLPEELTSDPVALERFRREARAASALNHPNVCTIHEIQEHDGQPFIAMELLEGSTLREFIAKEPVALDQQFNIVIQVAAGLEAAHQRGIIHRDIKPANIFITYRGEAKILDFGIAILADASRNRTEAGQDHAAPNAHAADPLNLTRTGVRTGTASYMSPEQIRGERLDARTDLFSFGLVLHELVTGHKPFKEGTVEELHDAILNGSPTPARELNPDLPPLLENIIDKALKKDREARYQTASEMRADLEAAARAFSIQTGSGGGNSWRRATAVLVGVIVVLLVFATGALLWLQPKPLLVPEVKQWQLTANTDENPIRHGQISPDGKYLAYSDLNGMHVQLITTGDLRNIPEPEEFKDNQAYYSGFGWFPDSTRLFENVSVPGRRDSIWTVSITGGAPRRLRDDADASSVSPDGSLIVFSRKANWLGDSEIWLMGPDGGHPRRLYETNDASGFTSIAWSPDSRRLACIKNHQRPGQVETLLETRDREDGRAHTTILADTRLRNISWLPDGRMIYSLADSDINGLTCNYWEIRVDSRTGKPRGAPMRLTNWAGFCTDSTGATADGKRLAFRRWRVQRSVHIADLELNGTRITTPHRLTNSEANEFPMAWMPDSKAVLFLSNRTGGWGILKQSLNSETAELVVKRTENLAVSMPNFEFPQPTDPSSISPDGTWILYVTHPNSGDSKTPLQLMRAPIAGGPPNVVLRAPIYGQHCARLPATLCAIAEQSVDRKELIFMSFDPVKGLGFELMRFNTDPNAEYEWDLSPDGTRIAIHKSREGRIYVLSLNGQPVREILVNGWSRFEALHWDADGTGFFGCSRRQVSSVLLHCDLQGHARLLWEHPGILGNEGSGVWGIPSPDGRHLALMRFILSSNMWVMEGF